MHLPMGTPVRLIMFYNALGFKFFDASEKDICFGLDLELFSFGLFIQTIFSVIFILLFNDGFIFLRKSNIFAIESLYFLMIFFGENSF